jgi:protocatechuate 3,4-dioxygenase beta subunit
MMSGTRYNVYLIVLILYLAVGTVAPAQPRCAPIPTHVEGPFYSPNAPLREATGKGLAVSGFVRSATTCEPIRAANIEWWQANPAGDLDDANRGALVTGATGGYGVDTDFPPPYYERPSHIHFKALAPGHRPLTAQLSLKGGERAVTFDLVLAKE